MSSLPYNNRSINKMCNGCNGFIKSHFNKFTTSKLPLTPEINLEIKIIITIVSNSGVCFEHSKTHIIANYNGAGNFTIPNLTKMILIDEANIIRKTTS